VTLAELRTTLTEWLEELEPWRGTDQGPEDYILTDEEYWRYLQVVKEPRPDILHVLLFTERNAYHISAILREDREPYLGCVASARYHRPGETWTRGNDLPDPAGLFLRETWDTILMAMLRYELQAMTKAAIVNIKTGGHGPDLATG